MWHIVWGLFWWLLGSHPLELSCSLYTSYEILLPLGWLPGKTRCQRQWSVADCLWLLVMFIGPSSTWWELLLVHRINKTATKRGPETIKSSWVSGFFGFLLVSHPCNESCFMLGLSGPNLSKPKSKTERLDCSVGQTQAQIWRWISCQNGFRPQVLGLWESNYRLIFNAFVYLVYFRRKKKLVYFHGNAYIIH